MNKSGAWGEIKRKSSYSLDSFHERYPGNLIFLNAYHIRRSVWRRFQECVYRFYALQSRLQRCYNVRLAQQCRRAALARMRSKAHGRPPRCVWPRVVTRVSSPRRSVNTVLTWSARMGLRLRSCAPSATMTMVFRLPISRCWTRTVSTTRQNLAECTPYGSPRTSRPPTTPRSAGARG